MRSQRLFAVAAAIVILIGIAATVGQAQENAITPEIVVDLQFVNEVAIAPDGKQIAYGVTVPRTEDDKPGSSYREVYVVPYEGGPARLFASKSNSSRAIAWSPDGNYLTFISKRTEHDDHAQIFQMRSDGGAAVPLTKHETAVSSYRWAPDARSIAFIATDAASQEEKDAKKAGEDWKVYDENFKQHRLWLLDIASGETRKLYEDELSVWAFGWTPDSKQIVFQGTDTPRTDDSYMFKKIYRMDVKSGERTVVCTTEGKLGGMAVSPDGKTLAFLGAVSLNDPLSGSLFVVPVSGGTARNLTEGMEATGSSVNWLDNGTVLLEAIKGTHTILARVKATDGSMETILEGGPVLQTVDLHKKSGKFAAIASSPDHPSEVFTGSVNKDKISRLTHHNAVLNDIELARQEVVEWNGADGWNMQGILVYPLDYEAGLRYPLVLQIHGGPEGVSLNGWTTRSTYPVQVLAAKGYVVFQPNYRGSAGRGVAFSKADHDDLGGKEFEDVLAGIDALVERGLVDKERVGTGGWSYGGYFSAWAATRHSERFKASVVAAGLTNWISFTGTTDIPHEMSLVHWNSYWMDERDLHWQRSPLYHIEKANTPTLVVHGEADDRVHPEQGIELYTTLKLKEVPTQLVLYPREPHGLLERAHQLDFINRVVKWFDKYLQNTGTF